MSRSVEITYYDFSDLNFSSFFLAGFHQCADEKKCVFSISKQVPPILNELLESEKWKDILFAIPIFRVRDSRQEYYFCIDTRDSNGNLESGKGYHLPLLQRVKFYFKVNYNAEVVNREPALKAYADRIIPAPPFFPIQVPMLWAHLPRFMPSDLMSWTFVNVISRMQHLTAFPSLLELKSLRNQRKTRDVFLMLGYYKNHPTHNEFRLELMKRIREHKHINAYMGFADKYLPNEYKEFQIMHKISLRKYLHEMAKSRVALYVRGMHDCFSFKFGQVLAMGMPIVGQPLRNNSSALMDNAHFDRQFIFEEPRDIVERLAGLLDNPDEMAMLGSANAVTFDSNYMPEKVASTLLHSMTTLRV